MTDPILAPIAALTLPDAATMTSRAERALTFIEQFEIATAEDYALAADELKSIKTRANQIEAQRTSITGPLNQALKAINALFGGPARLLDQAEIILKRKMLAWQQEQERIAAAERAKAEAAAAAERKRLADEAAARQAEAEAQARAAEAAAKAQAQAQAAAEAAQAAGDAQAAAAAQREAQAQAQTAQLAQAATQRAQAEAATATTTAQLVVAAPVVAPVAKTAGISTAKKLDFEVVDLHALVKHIAQHPELLSLLSPDSVRLRAYVRGLGTACALPGVRVVETAVMSARAA